MTAGALGAAMLGGFGGLPALDCPPLLVHPDPVTALDNTQKAMVSLKIFWFILFHLS